MRLLKEIGPPQKTADCNGRSGLNLPAQSICHQSPFRSGQIEAISAARRLSMPPAPGGRAGAARQVLSVCSCHRNIPNDQHSSNTSCRYCPGGGCHSSILLPSGSSTQPNLPYSDSSLLPTTLQPSARKASNSASRSATR